MNSKVIQFPSVVYNRAKIISSPSYIFFDTDKTYLKVLKSNLLEHNFTNFKTITTAKELIWYIENYSSDLRGIFIGELPAFPLLSDILFLIKKHAAHTVLYANSSNPEKNDFLKNNGIDYKINRNIYSIMFLLEQDDLPDAS